MKLTRKKTLKYCERKYNQRIAFLKTLRQIVKQERADNLIYLDESGFEANIYRAYGWSKRGQKTYGERSGKRGTQRVRAERPPGPAKRLCLCLV